MKVAIASKQQYEVAVRRAKAISGFSFIGWTTFRCKKLSNRITQFRHDATNLVFNLIPGDPEKDVRPFLLCQTPCTQDAWRMRARGGVNPDPSQFKQNVLDSLAENHLPVESVSWIDVQDWLALENDGLRLPYEKEWEHACRAGSTTEFYFGNNEKELGKYAWYSANSDGETHPVGLKNPNAFGLHDMSGLVWEWCEDEWNPSGVLPIPYAYPDDFDDATEAQSQDPFAEGQPARFASSGEAAGATCPITAGPLTASGTCRRTATTSSASGQQGRSDPFVKSQSPIMPTEAVAGTTHPGAADPQSATGATRLPTMATSASAWRGLSSDPFVKGQPSPSTVSTGAVAGATRPCTATPPIATGSSPVSGTMTLDSDPRGLSKYSGPHLSMNHCGPVVTKRSFSMSEARLKSMTVAKRRGHDALYIAVQGGTYEERLELACQTARRCGYTPRAELPIEKRNYGTFLFTEESPLDKLVTRLDDD